MPNTVEDKINAIEGANSCAFIEMSHRISDVRHACRKAFPDGLPGWMESELSDLEVADQAIEVRLRHLLESACE